MRVLPVLFLGLSAAGCAAGGRPFPEHPASVTPVGEETARLVVFRARENIQYSARAARLKVDGAPTGGLALGGFMAFDLPPGRHSLAVDMWDVPGACGLEVEAAAGETRYFEVAPRGASFVASLPGVLIPGGSVAAVAAGATVATAGAAVESGGKACGGAFAVAPADPEKALALLPGYRESR